MGRHPFLWTSLLGFKANEFKIQHHGGDYDYDVDDVDHEKKGTTPGISSRRGTPFGKKLITFSLSQVAGLGKRSARAVKGSRRQDPTKAEHPGREREAAQRGGRSAEWAVSGTLLPPERDWARPGSGDHSSGRVDQARARHRTAVSRESVKGWEQRLQEA